jgi:hypothetical protein
MSAQPLLFTPENGFSGWSQGDGSLKLLGSTRAFHVRSLGTVQTDGSFLLQQTISFEGEAPKTRSWQIRQVAPLHFSGTLSDAAGTVHGHTEGSRLELSYRVTGPIMMHQTLELQPDTITILNVGHITLLGIPIGSLHETIRRD